VGSDLSTAAIRDRHVALWLLSGLIAALLMAGCGTNGDASKPIQVGSTHSIDQSRAAKQAAANTQRVTHDARPGGRALKDQAKHQSFRSLAIAKVVTCLHRAGIEIPGFDPALLSSTSGIRTRNPQIKATISKCRSESLTAASR
jgi:hypothetical protein